MTKDIAGSPLEYATVSLAEQEVVVRIEPATHQAHVCSCSAVRSRRLAKRYGPPEKVSRDREGKVTAAFWTLPDKLIAFRRPRKPGSGNPTALARARAARKPPRRPRKPISTR